MTETVIEQDLQAAFQFHQTGHLGKAERLYRKILAADPKNADALRLMGILASQAGRYDIAIGLIRRAIGVKPEWPEAYGNLGNALKESGQLAQAITAYRQAIALRPDFPEAYGNLGVALKDNDEMEEAIFCFHHAIGLKADYADAYINLASAFKEIGRLDDAIGAGRQAIIINPDSAEAHANLGNSLTANHQFDEAIAACQTAIALKPKFPQAYNNLGNALAARGQYAQAIAAYRQALALKPQFAEAHSNLGSALTILGQADEAVVACNAAIAEKPNYPEAHSNLAGALSAKGRYDESIHAYRQAIALRPAYAQAWGNLANSLALAGQLDEAIAACREALALRPDYSQAHSNLLGILHYYPGYSVQAIADEHRAWNQKYAEPLQEFIPKAYPNDRNPDRRLRIGYVSPDFREHPVGRFMLPLLSHHDKGSVEVFAYAQVPVEHPITGQLRSHADCWRNIVGLSDAQVAGQIYQDEIDILVDLSGHTAYNRMLVFARKPAPIQVTYLGYPDTTGLATMDYRLTDAFADPPGQTEQYHSETLVRIPCAWCYDFLGQEPAVYELPALRNGHFTFGCLNNFCKINDPSLRRHATILKKAPGARLILLAPEGSARERVLDIFRQEQIDPSRLEFTGRVSRREYLELYNRIDVALDTFPYHGTATSFDALWMGVPLVSLAGPTHVSRVGVSLLNNIGLQGLVANSEEQYVRLASGLAGNLPRLARLRAGLRQRMQRSPLMDAARFARSIESAYRRMWTTWCESPAGLNT